MRGAAPPSLGRVDLRRGAGLLTCAIRARTGRVPDRYVADANEGSPQSKISALLGALTALSISACSGTPVPGAAAAPESPEAAGASSNTTDGRFLQTVRALSPALAAQSDDRLIKNGRITCDMLREGYRQGAMIDAHVTNLGVSESESVLFVAGSVSAYCPDQNR